MTGRSDLMPLGDGQSHHRRRVSFDPTINLGHMLTFVGFIVAIFVTFSAQEKRVAVVEQQSASLVERLRDQDVRFKEGLGELKSDIKDLQRSVNEVNRTLNAPAPLPRK
jgi:hypothetical protein